MTDYKALAAFAHEAAAYFERRDTGGEDMAFWANVTNAENCRKLASAIKALEAERDEARREVDEYLEPRLKSMNFNDGSFDIALTGKAVEAIAVGLVSNFKAMGAQNYVEMNIFDRDEPFQRYNVTVQKVGALSPADKVNAAEARCKRLEAQVEQAFRDGLAYATNVVVTDADEAWRTSRARLALQGNTNGG